MLKHKLIIDQMSVKQKIALLTNIKCLSESEFTDLGIPYTSLARLEDLLLEAKEGVTTNILARSWNVDGLKSVTHELVSGARGKGVNFIVAPSPKIKINPYRSAVSEDPYLSGELVGAYLNAVHRTGVPACISGFKFESDDVDYLDLELSRKVLYEYFILPFRIAAKQGVCHTVMASVSGPENGYGNVNHKLLLSAESGLFHVNMNVICDEHTPEATAEVWHVGGIVMEGVSTVLEHAYDKYNQILKAIHEGHATVNDLEDAYADGSAISDEMIDAAVSRVIDFAFACKTELGEDIDKDGSAENNYLPEKLYKAIKEAIVLLKNDRGLLPLGSGQKIAIIGDAAMCGDENVFARELSAYLNNNPCVGMAKGYVMDSDKDEDIIGEALKLAENADVVLLFLSIDSKRLDKVSVTKQLELPANQAALLEAMSAYARKTVAIVGGDVLPAARLGAELGAMILSPMGGKSSAHALADVLTAKHSPSGRLTESYYDAPDITFEAIKRNKDSRKNKIGPFMGYRLYDSSELSIRYPFGYGLSYTRFDYSRLTVSDKSVSLTVKNSGNIRGIETVQVYVGKRNSSYVRPHKELKAFKRVELEPNESKQIEIELGDLSIYDEQAGEFVVENGVYEIYVGASVSDIRLKGKINVLGSSKQCEKDDKRSDYLLSETNILSEKYTMEARGRKMKRSKKWAVGYIFGIIVAIIVNAMLIYAKIFTKTNYRILGRSVLGLIVVFNIFAISYIILAIVLDSISKARFRKRNEMEKAEIIKEEFLTAADLEGIDIDALFVKEFDTVYEKDADSKPRRGFDLSDYSRFVDDEMNFAVAQKALADHAANNRVVLSDELPGNVLSSLATSRLLMLNSSNSESIKRFAGVLSSYFGTEAYSEEIDASFIDGNLILAKTENGTRKTAVADMIKAAAEHKEKIHFVTLTGLTSELMANLFARYIRYLNNPERECVITVGDERYTVPENVWFLVSMNEGEDLNSLPIYMAELMVTLDVNCSEAEVVENIEAEGEDAKAENEEVKAEIRTLGYYQLSFLSEKARSRFAMPEELWKKVDSLEEYASKRTAYRFGNKLWLRLEKYLSVMNACEFESAVALDYTLNANVLHVIKIVIEGKLEDDDNSLLEALELYFGEDNVPICRKTLKGVSLT